MSTGRSARKSAVAVVRFSTRTMSSASASVMVPPISSGKTSRITARASVGLALRSTASNRAARAGCCGGQQEHRAIDDPPGDVAAQCRQQNAPNRAAFAQGHAGRTGKGQRHQQAEHDFGLAADRIEKCGSGGTIPTVGRHLGVFLSAEIPPRIVFSTGMLEVVLVKLPQPTFPRRSAI